MTTVLILVLCFAVIYMLVVFGKHHVAKDERARKKELRSQAETLYNSLHVIDAYDLLFLQTVKQMYRFRYQEANYEHLERDARLIVELRKSEIENDVLREFDAPTLNFKLGRRIPHHVQQLARG